MRKESRQDQCGYCVRGPRTPRHLCGLYTVPPISVSISYGTLASYLCEPIAFKAVRAVLRLQYSHRPPQGLTAASSPTSGWLRSLMDSTCAFASRVFAGEGSRRFSRTPVFRIARAAPARWMVERPGSAIEHAFPNLEQAVAFVRRESCDVLTTVELRIDDLYVVAQIDPYRPSSLFGEAPS